MTDKPGYQVLARKWRPQRFEDVVGQRPVVQTLSNALKQGRTAHAYCFSGIRGVGKTTIARLLAKGLNCRSVEAPTDAPCGQCESCTEIAAGGSIDVLERDAASDRGINEMKELIEIARYAPARDRYKVMILDEAHMLTAEASNALLKVLEEPPPYIVFVLATTEPNKILPTILSRCQHYQFGRISQGEITDHLRHIAGAEGVTVSEDGLALVATAADGSLRDAQSLLDKLIAFAGEQIDETTVVDLLGLVDRVLLFRATDLITAQDLPGVLGFVNEMVETGVDLHQFTIDLLGHMRNLLVVRTVAEPGDILHLPEDDVARLRQQAEAFEVDDLDRAFSLLATSEYRIKMAEQPRYHLEVVLARLARMPRLEPLENLIAAVLGEAEPSAGSSGARGGGKPGSDARRPPTPRPSASKPAPGPTAAPTATQSAAAGNLDEPPPIGELRSPPVAPTAPVTKPTPAPPPVEAAPTPASPSVDAGPTADEVPPAPSVLLQRIQAHVNEANPLIGPVLGRTSGISLAGEMIVFKFPASAGIFAARVRDPEALRLIGAAAEKVLGRRVIARVEIDADARPGTRGAPLPTDPQEHAETAPPTTAAETEAAAEAAPDASASAASDPLRARAENEPRVQEFVKALRGQITSVEEL